MDLRVLDCASIAVRPVADALQLARRPNAESDPRSSMAFPLAEPTPLHPRDSDVSTSRRIASQLHLAG